MCGIAGIVRLDGGSVDSGQMDQMTDALAHRGPDGRGVFLDRNVGLGHRRLAILDLSEAGHQPMFSKDQALVVTFNGEIYNFQEERSALEAKGYRFHSQCDTEVLLALYEEYGEACVAHLRGMFAFAIYDRKKNLLFLARDRVGKKPLKYFHANGVFAFASELKALRTLPECPREVDREMLHHFLTLMYMPAPETGFQGIQKLPAAHTMTLDLATGQSTIRRYWELSYEPDVRPSQQEWEERIWAVLKESVRLRMIADVPLGAFLSGGIDSGAIVALMSSLSDQPVKTFSIGSDDPAVNELPQALITARHFGTDHHPIELKADIVKLLPTLVQFYEEPYGDPSAIPTYLIAEATKAHVTVALNGDGGDENFAGYVRYPILQFSEQWAALPRPLHAFVRGGTSLFHRLRRDTLSYRMRRFQHSIQLPWEKRYLQYLSFFTEEEKRAIEREGFAASFPRTDDWFASRTQIARDRAPDILHQAMSMDLETYLAEDLLPKVDIGTMAHGLEARSPFLDHVLLELTATLPTQYQLRGRTTKWILKHMLKDILPREILTKKKTGFRLPLDRWFRGELRPWMTAQLLEAPHPLFWEMFDRSALEHFLDDYQSSRVNMSDQIWALLWLKEWTAQYT